MKGAGAHSSATVPSNVIAADRSPARRDAGGGRPGYGALYELFMSPFTQFLTTERQSQLFQDNMPLPRQFDDHFESAPDLLASTHQVKYPWHESLYIRLYRDQQQFSRPNFRHSSKYPASKFRSCSTPETAHIAASWVQHPRPGVLPSIHAMLYQDQQKLFYIFWQGQFNQVKIRW